MSSAPVVLKVGEWGRLGWFMMGCLVVSSVMVGLIARVVWWDQENGWVRLLGWFVVVCWVLVVGNVLWMSRMRAGERQPVGGEL